MAEDFLLAHSKENSESDNPQRSPLLALCEFYYTLSDRGKQEVDNCGELLLIMKFSSNVKGACSISILDRILN